MVSVLTVGGSFGLALAAVVLAFGQQQAQAPAGQVRMAEQQYKNIKVLNGTPANQLNLAMHGIAGSLGVDCVHCHTWEQFDKDGKPAKEVARRMITMVREMNDKFFGGAQMVTCYTCHRGSTRPVSTRIIADTLSMRGISQPPPPLPVEEVVKEPPTYPSPDAILAKYVQALGGEAAIRKVTSRTITAKRDYPFGAAGLTPVPATVEIYQQAPNLTVMISKAEKFTVSEGYDGQAAWAQGMNGNVNNVPEPDQQRAKRTSDFYESLDMAKNYSRFEVTGIEKINGRDAYEMVAYPQGDTPERLYFEVKTGLLLRRLTYLPTSLGNFPYAVDYDDYRKTGGVMFPFIIRQSPSTPRNEASTVSTLQILQVRDNQPIDASKFTRPPSKAPAGGGPGGQGGRGGPGGPGL